MFQQINVSVNRLASRNLSYISYNHDNAKKLFDCAKAAEKMKLHTTTSRPNYAAAARLPIPDNIDAAESTRFSPQRSRDISATVILSHYSQAGAVSTSQPLDITVDSSGVSNGSDAAMRSVDPHVQSYDCTGAVSLNSVMQSNVPSPFGGMHKFSHLNMPGGQWSQEGKFISQHLHNSHYTALRDSARSDWLVYDQDATVDRKALTTNHWNAFTSSKRSYSTAKIKEEPAVQPAVQQDATPPTLSKKEQLKRAFKDYGATVVVFHVTISLASLGCCYALVSGGIDMVSVLESLGITSATLTNKVATGASTFVVAYAIHKVFAPVRISITLGATPFIVRYLRSKGLLKPKIVTQK